MLKWWRYRHLIHEVESLRLWEAFCLQQAALCVTADAQAALRQLALNYRLEAERLWQP